MKKEEPSPEILIPPYRGRLVERLLFILGSQFALFRSQVFRQAAGFRLLAAEQLSQPRRVGLS